MALEAEEADPRKYVRLAALIGRRIQDRTLRPGVRAPSITELAAEQGGRARQTCAKALQALEAEGLLTRVPGLGYFVADIGGSNPHEPPILDVAELPHAGLEDQPSTRHRVGTALDMPGAGT